MRTRPFGVAVLLCGLVTVPGHAYDGLEADYKTCTTGSGKVANSKIVRACTRLINNAAKQTEVVGFFHALRASANTDKKQNCRDARIAHRLLTEAEHKKLASQLADVNCTARTGSCMQANVEGQIAEGRLSIGKFKDAAGRSESAYILTTPASVCLDAEDSEDRVGKTKKIHIFSSRDGTHRKIRRFVGKTVLVRGHPGAALTAHHHAPIIMDITEIDTQ